MKRNTKEPPRGVRFGWCMATRNGYLWGDVRSTKKELIAELLKAWDPKWTWAKVKQTYGLRIVWVKVEIVDND